MNEHISCPECGESWPSDLTMAYCGACGTHITTEGKKRNPYVEEQQDSSGGELRHGTVLFADIEGFTSFSEEREPEEVADVMGSLLERLAGVIQSFDGTVDKFIGDGVMATFGLAQPDDGVAPEAVRAGLQLHDVVKQFSKGRSYDFRIRVGIHAGKVMRVLIGNRYTVMGDTVNTAERIEEEAPEGDVLVSHPVSDALRNQWKLTEVGKVTLKGKSKPTALFSVRPDPSSEPES